MDSFVILEPRGRRVTDPFGVLIYQPSNNIYVRGGDTIYVYTEPQTFLAFGATGAATTGAGALASVSADSQIKFDAWQISLAEAVAKVGGINDGLADPAFVFLYRGEPRELLSASELIAQSSMDRSFRSSTM